MSYRPFRPENKYISIFQNEIALIEYKNDATTYSFDVFCSQLPIPIQPMFYLGNHGVSSEYISFFFCPVVILCTNLGIGMFYRNFDLFKCKQI